MKNILSLFFVLLAFCANAQNNVPTVNNVKAVKTALGFTITYDLVDLENENCEVFISASVNGGKSYELRPILATGDVGKGITPGIGKTINWQISLQDLANLSSEFKFRVVADDGFKPALSDIAAQIDSNKIYENFLKVYGNNSPTDPVHYVQTRERIKEHYEFLGLQTELDTFFSDVPNEVLPVREGINVYGTIQGLVRSDSTVLMTGHYDTVENTPGADDNNMSVAVCMEAARVLKDYSFRNNLRFANWDLEEIGLLGAYYYALSAKSLGTKAVINFDGMTIYKEEPGSQSVPTGFDLLFPAAYQKAEADSFRGNFITLITDVKSRELSTRAVELSPEIAPSLKYIDVSCPDPNCLIAADLRRSDHAPFWDRGVPAIFMTSSTEFRSACYHQPCDTNISLDFSTKVLKLATALMADKAGIMHAGKADSETLVTGINNNDKPSLHVSMPYPNPVVHSCFFELNLTSNSDIVIEIKDLQGKLVDVVNKKNASTGKQTIAWVPERNIATGSYLATIMLGGTVVKSFNILVSIDQEMMHQHK